MTSPPSVAIVILNWNGQHYLQQFLPSVVSGLGNGIRVIVADNASTDDSTNFLKSEYPDIKLIQLPKNFGFAGGYNEALKQIDTEYYVLLNSDVEVTQDWLQPMLQLMEIDSTIGACQPKVLSYKNKERFEYAGAAGGWIDSLGYPFARGRIFDDCEQDSGQYNKNMEIFWATGAALLIRSRLFHQLGGFDAGFFAHMEEIDLCWRLKLAGYSVYCCPASVVYHVGGGTLPQGNSRKTYLNYRNNSIMLAKNLAATEAWWKIPLRMALDQVAAFRALLGGDGGYFTAVARAQYSFLGWLLKKRRRTTGAVPLNKLAGVYRGSLVWQYFIAKKRSFEDLMRTQEKDV